jgi:hypothetical protein
LGQPRQARDIQHRAQIKEVLLVRRALRERGPRPLLRERLWFRFQHNYNATSGRGVRLLAAGCSVGYPVARRRLQ